MTQSEIRLYHGDCLDVMTAIQKSSVDLVIADLPYGTTKCKWDTQIDLAQLWSQYRRVCKPSAAILLFAQTPFDKVLGCSNLPWLRYEIVWEKTSPTGHLNAKKMPMKAHENILVFYDRLPTYNPQKTAGHTRKTATRRHDKSELYGEQNMGEVRYDSTERYPRSVITFPSDKQTSNLHPTQKPVALLEWLVRTYSNEGTIVLDNTMGSGSTGVACKNTRRHFIGIEKDQGYFKVAQQRLAL